jgi:hypothetical protein
MVWLESLTRSVLPADHAPQVARSLAEDRCDGLQRDVAAPEAGRIVAVADVFDAVVLDAFQRGLDDILAIRSRTLRDIELLVAA